MMIKYHVDGSSPLMKYYPSAYAIFEDIKIIKQRVLETNVNVYDIEFLALLECLDIAKKNSVIYSDNNQVVTEVNRKKKPKNLDYFSTARHLMDEKNIRVLKIRREDNLAGIYLDNRLLKLKNSREKMLNPIRSSKKSKKEKKRIYSKRRK